MEEPYSLKEVGSWNLLGDWVGRGVWQPKQCPTLNGNYIDPTSCSIPPFSYLYPTNSISPRGGSALICAVVKNPDSDADRYVERTLHGILISEPITNSDKNYIGESFFKILRSRTTKFQIKSTDHEIFISAEYVNMIELKDTINDHLTTWTEWTSCSPYCKRSRYRVCSGEFECYNDADGVSEPVLCTGRS